jgi:hypothetical protein
VLASSSLHPVAAAATRQVVARQLGSRLDALGSRLGLITEGVAHAVESSLLRARRKLRSGGWESAAPSSPPSGAPWLRGKTLGDLVRLVRRAGREGSFSERNQASKIDEPAAKSGKDQPAKIEQTGQPSKSNELSKSDPSSQPSALDEPSRSGQPPRLCEPSKSNPSQSKDEPTTSGRPSKLPKLDDPSNSVMSQPFRLDQPRIEQPSKFGRLFTGGGGRGHGSCGRGCADAPMAAAEEEDVPAHGARHRPRPEPPAPLIAFPRAALPMAVGPGTNTKGAVGLGANRKVSGEGSAPAVPENKTPASVLPSPTVGGGAFGHGQASPPTRDRPENPSYSTDGRSISDVPAVVVGDEPAARRRASGQRGDGLTGCCEREQCPGGSRAGTPGTSPALEHGARAVGGARDGDHGGAPVAAAQSRRGGGEVRQACGGAARSPFAYAELGAAHCAWGGSL